MAKIRTRVHRDEAGHVGIAVYARALLLAQLQSVRCTA